MARMTTEATMPAHTAFSLEVVRKTRDRATTTTPARSTAARGTSKGPISRSRTTRLAAGSPVAWSDQARTIHSTSTASRTRKPTMKRTLLTTRPRATRVAPNAPARGQ
jgi:hypothetical protein